MMNDGRSILAGRPVLDYLEAFRWLLLRSLGALLVGVIGGFVLVTQVNVLGVLIGPIAPLIGEGRLQYLSPTDPFFITLRLAFTIGLFVAAPVALFHAWRMASPHLAPSQKRIIIPAIGLAVVMFLLGLAMAYFVTLPLALRFLMGFQEGLLEQGIIASSYLSFVVRLLIVFGLAFELPVVLPVLAVLGLVTSRGLSANRSWAVVAATVLASALTPADIVSTFLLGVPLLLLYEMGILLTRLVERQQAAAAS
jgi:sec-independent protein translocase protein TatC